MFSELPPITDHRRHAACVRPNRNLQPPSVRPTGCGTCSFVRQRLTLDHHVRDQNTLGANRHRRCDRARYDVGGHAMGGLEAGFPTAAWTPMVRVDIGSTDLFPARVL